MSKSNLILGSLVSAALSFAASDALAVINPTTPSGPATWSEYLYVPGPYGTTVSQSGNFATVMPGGYANFGGSVGFIEADPTSGQQLQANVDDVPAMPPPAVPAVPVQFGGSVADIWVQYQMVLNGPGGATPESVNMSVGDRGFVSGSGGYDAYVDIAQAGPGGASAFDVLDCVGACNPSFNGTEGPALVSQSITLDTNTVYTVLAGVDVNNGIINGAGGFTGVNLDPSFSFTPTTPGSYSFAFSQGISPTVGTIVSAAPEPAAWALTLLGIGGIGLTMRSGKRKPAMQI